MLNGPKNVESRMMHETRSCTAGERRMLVCLTEEGVASSTRLESSDRQGLTKTKHGRDAEKRNVWRGTVLHSQTHSRCLRSKVWSGNTEKHHPGTACIELIAGSLIVLARIFCWPPATQSQVSGGWNFNRELSLHPCRLAGEKCGEVSPDWAWATGDFRALQGPPWTGQALPAVQSRARVR